MPKKLVKTKSYDDRSGVNAGEAVNKYKLRSVVEEIKKQ